MDIYRGFIHNYPNLEQLRCSSVGKKKRKFRRVAILEEARNRVVPGKVSAKLEMFHYFKKLFEANKARR